MLCINNDKCMLIINIHNDIVLHACLGCQEYLIASEMSVNIDKY